VSTAHAPAPRRRAIDEDRCKRVIAGTDIAALLELRADLIEISNRIRSQLEADNAAAMEELVEDLDAGLSPEEAGRRKVQATDHDWRARAKTVLRVIDSWITKIRARIAQINPGHSAFKAVSLPGVARNGEMVASALNQLIERGCKIGSFCVVGADLVVVASEPGAPLHKP